MQVKDIMTPAPACCTTDVALTAAARMLRDYDCGALPVLKSDTDPKLVGIITDRDMVVRGLANGSDPLHLTAGDCMTIVLTTVTPETTLGDCGKRMEEHQVRRVPVVDSKGECCGIVALADLARYAPARQTGEIVREVSRPEEPPAA
jgi:CBS domain-containing protein